MALEGLVLTLVSLGMVASLVAFISVQQAIKYQLKPDELFSTTIVNSPLYYVAHVTETILLVSAGLVALMFTKWRTIERGYFLRFALFLGAALLMTARSFSFSELLSTKIADWSGPFPLFVSVLVFVGARRRNWAFLDATMVVMAVLFSVLTLVGMAGLRTFTRQEGVASLGVILNTLYWPASWVALRDYPQHSPTRRFRLGPLVIFGFGGLLTQTRLLFVMLFSSLIMYAYVQHRRKIPQATGWLVGIALTVWIGLFTAVFLKDTRGFEKVASVADAFSSRLSEDTRTGQLLSFEGSVQLHELVLGRGALATWNWGGTVWHGGTDVGYLTLLFYGGVPLLVTYVATHLKPCLIVFRKGQTSWQLTAAAIVFLWGIRMFSSSYPGLALEYYPILFCTGACISRDSSRQSRSSSQIHFTRWR